MKRIGYILLGAMGLGLMLLYNIYNPGDHDFFPKCVLHGTTGLHCPGCGSQRAIHSLLHGDLLGTVGNNLLLLPVILVIGYHYGTKLWGMKKGMQVKSPLQYSEAAWIVLIAVVLFAVFRNIHYYPFTLLAPN